MTERIRDIAALCLAALAAGLALACATAGAAGIVSPLPATDYSVKPVCGAPSRGSAGCMSMELLPRTAAARAHNHPIGMARLVPTGRQAASGVFGLTPQNLQTAYGLPTTSTATQTIALVDAYNDPTAKADLNAYSKEFGLRELPECTKEIGESGCFMQVNQNGGAKANELPFPKNLSELKTAQGSGSPEAEKEAAEAAGWGVEISLDIETAHAICETCKIVLVEASSPSYFNLETAENQAATLGANEISNSWGGPEDVKTASADSTFNHPGIVITASSGDNGYKNWGSENSEEVGYTNFPASSPHVVAVGGTRLELNETGGWQSEAVWNGNGAGGGGCSEIFFAPIWQRSALSWSSVGCGGFRAVADVSADADPYSGLAIHDSTPGANCEEATGNWCTVGGTSLASPLIAAVFALAGGAGEVTYPARTLYENEAAAPASLHDITSGSNAACLKPLNKEMELSTCTTEEEAANSNCPNKAICLAGVGYDGPTGVGTPNGIEAFEPTGKPEAKEEPKPGNGGGESGGEKTTTTSGAPAGPTPTPAPASPEPVQLSALSLTVNAIVALNNSHPKISQIGFAFTINATTTVRLTLAKRVHVHHRSHWKTLGRSTSASAFPGRNTWRLGGRGRLSPGRYRITLTPTYAASKSLTFLIG
jgi:Subtilase family